MRTLFQGQPAPLLFGFAEGLRAVGLMLVPLVEALFLIVSKAKEAHPSMEGHLGVQTLIATMVPSPFAHQECGAAADQDFRKRCFCRNVGEICHPTVAGGGEPAAHVEANGAHRPTQQLHVLV